MDLIDHIDDRDVSQLRPPLEDHLLERLGDKAIPDEPLGDRITHTGHPAQALELAPEPGIGIVDDRESASRLIGGLGVEPPIGEGVIGR